MGGKNLKYLAVFLFVCLCINFVSASFVVDSHSIDNEYSPEESVQGWINISFENEPSDSYFNDSFGNSITLAELLNENSGFVYELSGGEITNLTFQKLYLDNGSFFLPETLGNYSYQLTLDGTETFSEEIFIIAEAGEVNETLQEKLNELDNIKTNIAEFDVFTQSALNEVLGISEIEKEITELKEVYENSTAEESEILANLSEIIIPESVYISRSSGSISFFPKEIDINLDFLESLGGTYESGKEATYTNSILLWNQENIETKITFTELSAVYTGYEEDVLRIFNAEVTKKKSLDYSPYFILENLNNLNFKENYGEKESGNYVYMDLTETENTISFSTTDNFDFTDVPLVIAPLLSELVLSDEIYEPNGGGGTTSKWIIFTAIIILLIIVGVVIYIALQTWYKKKYENYLFKNKNDLYNLATYITTAKKKGISNSQIIENLKKAKWNSEQIRYVVRKYAGKRTGMLEIPVEKILKKRKV